MWAIAKMRIQPQQVMDMPAMTAGDSIQAFAVTNNVMHILSLLCHSGPSYDETKAQGASTIQKNLT